jgi:3-oxo-5-alpha-steroid 4-dehydrogenase 1
MQYYFNIFLGAMAITALVSFVMLFFVTAGYGKFTTKRWGPSVNNKIGWLIMEAPVFIVMLILWLQSTRKFDPALLVIFLLFQIHYFQRSFIFPMLLKGKSRMPLSIILMGAVFNTLNGLMQGGWLFYISPENRYPAEWLGSWQFIVGTIIFATGFFINIQSDSIVRNLRKTGDTKHYLPKGGLYNYVTSANYFGEILEWTGFAILTWSWAGAVFAWWTFANLVPRANKIFKKYSTEFADEMKGKNLKRVIPFIY